MRGERLRELREKRGLTQLDLSVQLGVSEPQIWRYENRNAAPNSDALLKLALFFDVSTDYLLGRTDYPGVYIDGDLSPREVAAISAWRQGDYKAAIKAIVTED